MTADPVLAGEPAPENPSEQNSPPSTAVLFLFDESSSMVFDPDQDQYREANYDLARFYLTLLRTYYTQEWKFGGVLDENMQAASKISLGVSAFAADYISSTLPLTTVQHLAEPAVYDQVYDRMIPHDLPETMGTDTGYVNAFERSARDLDATHANRKILVLLTDSDEYHDHLLGVKDYRDAVAEEICDIASDIEIYVAVWGTDLDQQGDTTLDFWRSRRDEGTVRNILDHERIYEEVGGIAAVRRLLPAQNSQGGWLHIDHNTIEFPGAVEQSVVVIITSKPTDGVDVEVTDEFGVSWGKEGSKGKQWLIVDGHVTNKNRLLCPIHRLTVERLDKGIGYYWFDAKGYPPSLENISVLPPQWVINEGEQQELSIKVNFEDSLVGPTYPNCYSVRTEISVLGLEETLSRESPCRASDLKDGLVHTYDGSEFPIGLPWHTASVTTTLVFSGENGSLVQSNENGFLSLVYKPVILADKVYSETTASWDTMEKELDKDVIHHVTFTVPISYAMFIPNFKPEATLSMSPTEVLTKESCVKDETIKQALTLIEERNNASWYQVVYDYRKMLEENCYSYLLITGRIQNNEPILWSYPIARSDGPEPCEVDLPLSLGTVTCKMARFISIISVTLIVLGGAVLLVVILKKITK
jgi:hypothetical protein